MLAQYQDKGVPAGATWPVAARIVGQFLVDLLSNRSSPGFAELVRITPRGHDGDYEEFPTDPDLAKFDLNGRKWVAAAIVSSHSPEIVNVSDSDYVEFREPLERYVRLNFLCPELFRAQ